MKKRSEIEEKYKWDLTKYCKSEADFFVRLENLEKKFDNLAKFSGKLSDDKSLLECLQFDSEISKEFEALAVYGELCESTDVTNQKANEMCEKISLVGANYNKVSTLISTEIDKFSTNRLKNLIQNAKFKDFSRMFEKVLRAKKHTLSKKEELLLSNISEVMGESSNVFDKFSNGDLKFDDIKDEKGKSHPLSPALYGFYIKGKDRTLRKNAREELLKKYKQFAHTISVNYIANVKEDCVLAKIRKFDSALSASIFAEEASEKVYKKLIEIVRQNLDIPQKYLSLKRKTLGFDKLFSYDVFAPAGKIDRKFTYDEAIEVIKSAVAPLGEDYVKLIQKAKDERWIDVYPNENKCDGAFSTDAYMANPVVLTNFNGTIQDVFDLAHELGHAIHSYFSSQNQPFELSHYVIYVAEVASQTNEMLLFRYFLKNAKSTQEKLYFYETFFNLVYGAIFRQVMFAEFEQFSHETYEKQIPLTKELLCEKFAALSQEYDGKEVQKDELSQYAWMRIHHFYRAFYVYKYAIGLICAIKLSSQLCDDKNFKNIYKKFLSAGSTKDPISILKDATCDLTKDKIYEDAFSVCREILKDWDKELKSV